jgi:hypothetical protein
VKSEDVVQMRCNAGEAGDRGRVGGREGRRGGEERGERGKGKRKCSECLGRSLRAKTGRVLYPLLSPDTGAISRYRQSGQLGPHLFSIPPSQIEISFPSSLPTQSPLPSPFSSSDHFVRLLSPPYLGSLLSCPPRFPSWSLLG